LEKDNRLSGCAALDPSFAVFNAPFLTLPYLKTAFHLSTFGHAPIITA